MKNSLLTSCVLAWTFQVGFERGAAWFKTLGKLLLYVPDLKVAYDVLAGCSIREILCLGWHFSLMLIIYNEICLNSLKKTFYVHRCNSIVCTVESVVLWRPEQFGQIVLMARLDPCPKIWQLKYSVILYCAVLPLQFSFHFNTFDDGIVFA